MVVALAPPAVFEYEYEKAVLSNVGVGAAEFTLSHREHPLQSQPKADDSAHVSIDVCAAQVDVRQAREHAEGVGGGGRGGGGGGNEEAHETVTSPSERHCLLES